MDKPKPDRGMDFFPLINFTWYFIFFSELIQIELLMVFQIEELFVGNSYFLCR